MGTRKSNSVENSDLNKICREGRVKDQVDPALKAFQYRCLDEEGEDKGSNPKKTRAC